MAKYRVWRWNEHGWVYQIKGHSVCPSSYRSEKAAIKAAVSHCRLENERNGQLELARRQAAEWHDV